MKRDEFDKSIHQLLNLLKKILKNHPAGPSINQLLDSKNLENVVLNLCFFNFIPMTSEEMDEFEDAFHAAQDHAEDSQDSAHDEAINHFGWNEHDVEFLKRNGIKF